MDCSVCCHRSIRRLKLQSIVVYQVKNFSPFLLSYKWSTYFQKIRNYVLKSIIFTARSARNDLLSKFLVPLVVYRSDLSSAIRASPKLRLISPLKFHHLPRNLSEWKRIKLLGGSDGTVKRHRKLIDTTQNQNNDNIPVFRAHTTMHSHSSETTEGRTGEEWVIPPAGSGTVKTRGSSTHICSYTMKSRLPISERRLLCCVA